MNTLYQQYIMDLYQHPLNKEKPEVFDRSHKEHNPLCGDSIEIFIKIDNNTIQKMSWIGEGCAISSCSASLLSDHVVGKSIADIENLDEEKVMELLKLENLNPSRLRCAMLPLEALKKCLTK